MSRLGKLPIELPAGTKASLEGGFIIVKGPKGELKTKMHEIIKTAITDKEIKLSIDDQTIGKNKALWGLFRSLIKNMVVGVNEAYVKKLEINGVGYKAAASGNKLTLNVGYSHPVIYNLPDGIKAEVQANVIIISGIDKQLVGEVAAQIRKIRKPEPYKGKGIKYSDEILRRKAGKTAGKTESK